MNKTRETFKIILVIAAQFASILLAIFGLLNSHNINNVLLFTTLLICFIIVTIYSIYASVIYIRSKNVEQDKERKFEKYENKISNLEKDLNDAMSNLNITSSELTSFLKSTIKSLNTSLQKACIHSDTYYYNIDTMMLEAEKDMTNKDKKEIYNRIKEYRETYKRNLFETYNFCLRQLINDTKKTIESYLSSKDIPLPVSVSLKLLNVVHFYTDNPADKFVFTAFRDIENYIKGIREVGRKRYSIVGNSAFTSCLTNELFIYNNIPRNAENYKNENPNFYDYYNCVVAVPILFGSTIPSEKLIYGFLCCDVLNEDKSVEDIFNRQVSEILSSTAMVIANLFAKLNYPPWYDDYDDGDDDDDDDEEFLTYIYKTIFRE